jgi:SAM-dependent methyltransferase
MMTDWTSGYVADIDYTFGYYQELNPLRVKLAFLKGGLVSPDVGAACELGFGQGLSANVHAAASLTSWHATDFNPAQAGFARELANSSGADAHLFDDAFADFVHRSELPDFDFIGLHGIWSWISDENRTLIADFVRRKLKVGGVLYISYNTLPGWGAMVPMRHLLCEHFDVVGAPGDGIVPRIDGALDFVEKLLATNPAYARNNPQIAERFRKLKEEKRNYLAHEYFNRDWHPMPFATMRKWLETAKVDFACSAHYLDSIDSINLGADQQAFLKEIPDAMLRETARDFMVNQNFRRDYWVRGARKVSPLEQSEGLRAQRVILTQPRGDVTLKVSCVLGTAMLQEAIYAPIIDALATNQPMTLGQIEQAVKARNLSFQQVLEAVIMLTGRGNLHPVQDDATIDKARQQTDKLNRVLCDKARGSNDIHYLASPVTGGGVGVGRFQQLFLLARREGKKQAAEWAHFAWETLSAQGQRIQKGGKTLENPEENLAELTAQATTFADKQLPILKSLQIV